MNSLNKTISLDEDNILIQKYLASRDTRYLGELYERYKQRIFIHCLKMTNNQEEAKDLTSNSFFKAIDNIDKFKIGSPFFPWIRRIASNLCIDFLRKKSRYKFQQLSEKHATTNKDDDLQNEVPENLKHKILQVLKMLKPLQRRCFCLFYIHNFSYNEIIKITGYSSEQVRSHIQNGRRRFKIIMEQL